MGSNMKFCKDVVTYKKVSIKNRNRWITMSGAAARTGNFIIIVRKYL